MANPIISEIAQDEHHVVLYIKGGKFKVNTDDPSPKIFRVEHPLFKAVERYFFDWYQNAHAFHKEPYQNLDGPGTGTAAFSKIGAIEGAIYLLLEIAEENNLKYIKSSDWHKLDLEIAFTE